MREDHIDTHNDDMAQVATAEFKCSSRHLESPTVLQDKTGYGCAGIDDGDTGRSAITTLVDHSRTMRLIAGYWILDIAVFAAMPAAISLEEKY